MTTSYDAIVIGAGPAGMAAGITLARHGARALLLDEQPGLGGQIYRTIEESTPAKLRTLGADYARGLALTMRVRESQLEYLPGSAVWNLTAAGDVHYSHAGRSQHATAQHIILATGAMERPVPVPGWTLPGVVTAGALQILLKSSGVVSTGVFVAGTGPLLYQLAYQYVAAGMPRLVILDMATKANTRASLRHLPAALNPTTLHYLWKGFRFFERLARAGVPIYRNVSNLVIEGADKVESVSFRHGGKELRLPAHTIGLHAGVIPNTHIPRAVGCAMAWDAAQHCFRPATDEWGTTSHRNFYVAGDGARIVGARASEHAGHLSALQVLHLLDRFDATERDRLAVPHRRAYAAHTTIRPFLDRRFAPPAELRLPADDTIVCRCEEITAGQIRAVARAGCQGPNQAKAYLRAGMGPCQGRVCGPLVTDLMAEIHARSPAEIGAYRARPPFKPLTVGELAALD